MKKDCEGFKFTVRVFLIQAELTVHYRGTPAPMIAWYKDGLEIFSGRRHRIVTENGASTLIIHQAALSDEGEIKCTATNRVGHAVTKATLQTEGKFYRSVGLFY